MKLFILQVDFIVMGKRSASCENRRDEMLCKTRESASQAK